MKTLRAIVGLVTALAFLWSIVLLIIPFFWPGSVAPLTYFAVCLFGVFALLRRKRCWISAVILHLLALLGLIWFCPPGEQARWLTVFVIYATCWWLSVGYASLRLDEKHA